MTICLMTFREAGVRQVTCIFRGRKLRHHGLVAPCGVSRPFEIFLPRSERLELADVANIGFMVASSGVLSKRCGLASAWAMGRRRSKQCRRGAWRRAAPAYTLIHDLTWHIEHHIGFDSCTLVLL